MTYEPHHSATQVRSDRTPLDPFEIIDFSVFSTSICNSGCQTCDIWQETRRVEFPAGELERLMDVPLLKDVAFVLLGGEFTIHSEYLRIMRGLNQRKHPYYMFSNGILPQRIYDVYEKAGGITNLSISVDAMGKRHDKIRGFPGNFEKIMEISEWVRTNHPETFLRFAYTVSPYNTRADLEGVIEYAEWLGVDVRVGYMAAISIFSKFTDRTVPQYYEVADLYRDKYISLYTPWAKGWSTSCHGIYHHPLVMQDGRLLLCQNLGVVLGNVIERRFEDIWADPLVREKIRSYESCNACWQSCDRKWDAERLSWPEIEKIREEYEA
jgi:MoaA/NifB/PqqE/SkfB family radical SAM enzyme